MFIQFILKYKKSVVFFFTILTLISAVSTLFVSTNYNMVDYLPDDAPSTEGLEVMENEFDGAMPNAEVLIEDVSIQEALVYKEQLGNVHGVTDVTWLDDLVDLQTPLQMQDESVIESYYQDGNALFSITIESEMEVDATEDIYALIGENNAITGEAVNTATQQTMASDEALFAALLLVPTMIVILVLSTKSWIEPIFFLTAIGVSVIINLGTNIFLGEISFITQSVAPVLQLAVSLDYAIFLLHAFSDERKKNNTPEEAMAKAMKASFPVILVSALTTFFGFMSLMLMDFEIGADLGLNLVKGIVFSFISVTVLLPALTLTFYRWMEKTEHRSLIPDFTGVGAKIVKFRIPAIILVAILIVPSFLAQSSTSFIYGLGELPEETRAGADVRQIDETFGQSTPMVLLVPNDDIAREAALAEEIEDLSYVDSVMSYATMIGTAIPSQFLEDTVTEEFLSENYSRMMIFTSIGIEGNEPFALVEQVRALSSEYYGDETHHLGESATLYDMKETVTVDNQVVNTMTIVSIAIVLMITFKSLSIPIILLVTIQAAVWINLSIPYFTDDSLVFVGYLVVSTVQLAATIDYGILLKETYKEYRKEMPAMPAMKRALDEKLFSILVSATILSSVGFILWFTSDNPTVSSIGLLLGRGALLAFVLVIFLLPALLLVGDRFIKKTTYKPNYYEEEEKTDA